MPDLEDLAAKALSQRGDPYIFGAEARFDDANPRAFDCSELVEWSCARLGVTFVDGAENQRNACRNAGTVMSVQNAIRTKGALLFRINVDGDHVAISLGDGKTIEARGSAYGVNVFDAVGRTWTDGGFPPGFGRDGRPTGRGNELGDRMLERGDRGEDVRWVQRRLKCTASTRERRTESSGRAPSARCAPSRTRATSSATASSARSRGAPSARGRRRRRRRSPRPRVRTRSS